MICLREQLSGMLKRSVSALFISCLLFPLSAQAAEPSRLKPFTSDGCSSFPDGTLKQNELWLVCCTTHDFAYWKGGTYKERMEADNELKDCVAGVGEPQVALIMLAGVRVGGSPFWPTRFRWGYGWPWPRFYGALDAAELEQVNSLAEEYYQSSTEASTP